MKLTVLMVGLPKGCAACGPARTSLLRACASSPSIAPRYWALSDEDVVGWAGPLLAALTLGGRMGWPTAGVWRTGDITWAQDVPVLHAAPLKVVGPLSAARWRELLGSLR